MIDIRRGDLGDRARDLHTRKITELDLWINLENRRELELIARRRLLRFDPGVPRDA